VICGANSGSCSDCSSTNLSTAVWLASSGDTIQVCGEFELGLWLIQDLTVEGVGSGAYFLVSNDNSFYLGSQWNDVDVTLRNLNFSGHTKSAVIVDHSIATIEGCSFDNNDNYDGPAIQSMDSTLTIDNSSFTNNSGTLGGALILEDSNVSITNSSFSQNDADYGGGIYASNSSLSLDSVEFENNDGLDAGGAIYAIDSTVEIANSSLRDNTSSLYGGALALDTTTLLLTDNRLIANEANSAGGGIVTTGSTIITSHRNLWCANTSDLGGAAYLLANAEFESKNDIYMLNEAQTSGGAFVVDEAGVSLINNDFIGNEAFDDGSGSVYGTDVNSFEFINNLVSDGMTSLIVTGSTGLTDSDVDYNHWFDSSTSFDSSIDVGANNDSKGEPILVNPYPFTNADLPDCTDPTFDLLELRPQPASPLIDEGTPDICDPTSALGCTPPATGSQISDIGAFGGDQADGDWYSDEDGDGLFYLLDCDDTDQAITSPSVWYADTDQDGYGDPNSSVEVCDQPAGYIADNTDCNDNDDSIIDGQSWYDDEDGDGFGDASTATEGCNPPTFSSVTNGDDCDDSDSTILDSLIWYLDADGDGYGDPSQSLEACDQPTGYVANEKDCDDSTYDLVQVYPWWFLDSDGDGYGDPNISTLSCTHPAGYVSDSSDCDDADPNTNIPLTWYLDSDGDGYGDLNNPVESCTQPAGHVRDSSDCDDTDASVWMEQYWYTDSDGDGYGDPNTATWSCTAPSAAAVTNDEDCDDTDSTLSPETIWYKDKDGDGYGDPEDASVSCTQPSNFVANDGDCDDLDTELNPDTVWYLDADSDGYGDPSVSMTQCDSLDGYVTNYLDCNDTNGAEYPGVSWYADGDADTYGDPNVVTDCAPADPTDVLDNSDCDDTDPNLNPNTVWYPDCDGDGFYSLNSLTQCEEPTDPCADGATPQGGWSATTPGSPDCDDSDPDQDPSTLWYLDSDSDGFGAGSTIAHIGCSSDYTGTDSLAANDSDCDDLDPTVYPGADEYCDGEDDDCDGEVDEDAVDPLPWQADCDGDGYLGPVTITVCLPSVSICADGDTPDGGWLPAGATDEDCDDEDPDLNPLTEWWPDLDGDSYGDEGSSAIVQCESPGDEYTADHRDCDDGNPNVNIDADEMCNGIDDNCDELIDDESAIDALAWHPDCDGDGYFAETRLTSCEQPEGDCADGQDPDGGWTNGLEGEADCNDEDPELYPRQNWYLDEDSDSYGRFGQEGVLVQCEQPNGYVSNDQDCDDTDANVNPIASEVLSDGVDNNCDGFNAKTWFGGSGCSCSANPSRLGWWALLLPVLWWTRRRDLVRKTS
jgi:hypothetical protein